MTRVDWNLRETAAEMRQEGRTYREIADHLGVSFSTVCRWLNPEAAERERRANWLREKRRRQGLAQTRATKTELEQTIVDLRIQLVAAQMETATLRKRLESYRTMLSRVRKERDKLRDNPRFGSFTEAQQYWLATVTPEEFERISEGWLAWEGHA